MLLWTAMMIFLNNWKKLGGDEVTKEAQQWYDANK